MVIDGVADHVHRVKVLVLYPCQAMSALTVCRTNWSTSLLTMDSASTSSVLVSISCMKCLFFPEVIRQLCFSQSHKMQKCFSVFRKKSGDFLYLTSYSLFSI